MTREWPLALVRSTRHARRRAPQRGLRALLPCAVRANRLGAACRNAWRVAGLAVALAAGPGALGAQITVDASSSATISASTLTWAHTVGSGSNRFLVVGVSIRNAGNTVSGVTYGGAALTFIGARNNHDDAVRTEMWYRAAPAVGTANVVITLTGGAKMVGGAVSFFGVSATAPLGTFVANNSTNTGTDNPSVVVTSAAGELIISALSTQGSAGTVTPLAGQTQRWNLFYGTSGGDPAGFGSTAPGAASVTMGWTKTGTAKWAIGAVALKPALTTTIGDGIDPANASLAPGGAATMADAFTLQTNSGTDAITKVAVTLAAGTAGGLSLVEITDNAGTTVYGSVTDPASDTPSIGLTTSITATTTSTQYKVRVTPKSHANMPVPAGSSYAVTARISVWSSTNAQAGSDAAGTTVTIDNLSPGDVTAGGATAGSAAVLLNWTNPGDADLSTIAVLRRAMSAVTDVPAEGATYAVGNTIGTSTVACVVTAPAASCTDTGLTNGIAYHYEIFTRDVNGNYSIGAVPSGSPATPTPTISGNVFEDVNYGGGAGRSKATSSGVSRSGARVELYTSAGVYSTFATTDGSGDYSFTNVAAGTYYIRVVNASVTSSRTGYTSSALAVQTYRTDATSGTAAAVTDYVGGTDPAVADPGSGSAGATFNSTTFVYSAVLSGTAQSVTTVVVGSTNISGLDFGFNFNTVVNVNHAGQGSLRQFLANANLLGNAGLAQAGRSAGIDNAIWMISNGSAAAGLRAAHNAFSGGVATIAPTSALPVITDPVILDAQTQPGWASAPIVQLSGISAGPGARGLELQAGGSTVRGFIINGFTGNANSAGVWIATAGSNVIQGNYIGTNAAGNGSVANYQGVYVATSGNTIGGSGATQRNVISGNTWRGILVTGGGATSNVIRGNYVGTDAAGTSALANNIGIYLSQAPNNVIGGTGIGEGNVTSGNTNFGLYLVFSGASGNLVQGNTVGLNASRSGAVPNGSSGIELCCAGNGGSGNTIGGTAAEAANIISGNTGRGIVLRGGTGNGILGNSIYGNGGIGLDLGADGITPNDGAKPAGQPNLEMDFPVFTSVLLSGTTLTVTGYVGSAASQPTFGDARVEIFRSDLDASGYGEGQVYLGFVTTDASGNFSGALAVSGLAEGDQITGTATDGANNTSEFGANATALAPAPSMSLAEGVTPSGTQLPGTDLAYTTTFANVGTAGAQSVVITDLVPAETDFKVGSETHDLGTTGLTVVVDYSSDGGSTWTYTPASGAGGAPAGYDRLVTHVRWAFTGNLSQTAPNNAGSTGVTLRIR